jgi:hypothetical protein
VAIGKIRQCFSQQDPKKTKEQAMADKPDNIPGESDVQMDAVTSRRSFLKSALAAGAAALTMGESAQTAQAADPKPQQARAFKMQTVNRPWTDPANDTLDAILQDPIQYPGRDEIGFVPAPGNKVPTYVPGVRVPYHPITALNQSPTFQALDAASRKAVIDLYAVRHGYALEHEQYRIAQHNALTGGQGQYPILYEKVIGKPLKEDGTPDKDARDQFQGYVCKPAGNDTVDDKLPYFAFDERTYSMKGKIEGPADNRWLVLELTMKADGLGFSYGQMEGCEVNYIQKASGKGFALKVDGADINGLDPKRVEAFTGTPPKKGDIIEIAIPAEILRKPLKAKVGAIDRGDKETMYAQAPASHGDRILADMNKPIAGREGPA